MRQLRQLLQSFWCRNGKNKIISNTPAFLMLVIFVFSLAVLNPFEDLIVKNNKVEKQVAAGVAVAVSGRGQVANANGYINFTDGNANVAINSETCLFSGYAWLDDAGWAAFGTTDNSEGPVQCNLYTGAVTGKAKLLEDGSFIDFNAAPYNSNVKISSAGIFSGYAWSTSLGWINFTGVESGPDLIFVSPDAPQSVRIYDTSDRALSDYSVTVRWLPPINLDAGSFEAYLVERSTDNVIFAQVSSTASTGYLDTQVSNGTTYYYRIKAKYVTGTTATSATVSQNPTGKYTAAPTLDGGPTVEVKPTSIEIAWHTDRESSSYVKIMQGNTFVSEQGHADFEKEHAVTVTGLLPATAYNYQIRWVDIDGNLGETEILALTTASPPVISEVQVTNIALTSALVSWKTTSLASNDLYYGTDITYGKTISGASAGTTTLHSAEITGLDSGTIYHFKIRGSDTEGNALVSDDYSFSTLPMPSISNVATQPIADRPEQALKISWTTNVSTSSTITYKNDSTGVTKEVSQSELVTAHELETGALSDSSTYSFTASGRDQFGNLATTSLPSITTKNDTRPPKITDFTVDTQVNEQGGDQFKVVVSWKTDEPATSKVEFGVGIGESALTQSSQETTSLDTSHVVVLSGLEASQTYQFRAVSKDATDNLTKSESQILVTNQPTATIFSLIMTSLERAFGWVGKIFK